MVKYHEHCPKIEVIKSKKTQTFRKMDPIYIHANSRRLGTRRGAAVGRYMGFDPRTMDRTASTLTIQPLRLLDVSAILT